LFLPAYEDALIRSERATGQFTGLLA
jgi:hypothetical protein